jgi:hypothetical protein
VNDEVIWKAVAMSYWPFIAHKHETLKDYEWKQYHIYRSRVSSNWDEHKCKVRRVRGEEKRWRGEKSGSGKRVMAIAHKRDIERIPYL